MFSRIGAMELVLIFGLVLLIFGPSRLPELAKSMGSALKSIRKETQDLTDLKNDITGKE